MLIFEDRLPRAIQYVLDRLHRDNGAVLVHCHAGNDRTGGVMTGYLMRTRGLSPDDALALVRETNPDAISAFGYEEMLLRVLEETLPRGKV
ncbi:MAG: dual specificity protein phosphatase family protein [Planctomycetota bacterium]